MIQRIQSVYLAISILLLIVSSCFPWGYIINRGSGDVMEVYNLYVNSGTSYSLVTLPLFLIQMLSVILSVYTIYSYGNRRNQMRLCTLILILLCGWHLLATVFFLVLPNADKQEAEQASFHIGQSLYQSTPEPRLDQTATVGAIAAYQQFLDYYPESSKRSIAQSHLYELQDKLVMKELLSARLYYNLGGYFSNCIGGGSNYEACIVTSQNALKTYPYSKLREEFAVLIMKSKFELAQQSVEEKKMDRYRDAEDECYGFLNEYPESSNAALANQYLKKCKKIIGKN